MFLAAPATSAMKLTLQQEDSVDRFCPYCDTVSSGDVKHCKLCERCVIHMDHHCLFLMKCVATHNHRLFTIFIIIVNLDIFLFLFSSIRHYFDVYHNLQMSDLLLRMCMDHVFVFFVIILNLFSAVWGVFVVQWQLKLIGQGYTYYETLGKSKESFQVLGRGDQCRNIVRFFQGNKTPHKIGIV